MMGYFVIFLVYFIFVLLLCLGLNWYTFGIISFDILKFFKFIQIWYKSLSYEYLLMLICIFIVFLAGTISIIVLFNKYRRNRINVNTYSHGTARFATWKEMSKQELFKKREVLTDTNSILLAQSEDAKLYETSPDRWKYRKKGKYLVAFNFDKTPAHVMLVSSTRGGKGTGTIISTLLTWKDSVIVFDPKAENYDKTAGFRSRFSKVIRISPSDPQYAHFNPLDFLRPGAGLMNDANNIAYIILPKNPQENQPFFSDTGRMIIALGIMYVVFFEKVKSLSQVYQVLVSGNGNETFMKMSKKFRSVQSADAIVQETLNKCALDAESCAALPAVTLGGCKSSATTALAIFALPTIKMITNDSSFTIDELVTGNRPVSVYLTVNVDEIESTAAYTRMIFSVINRNLMREWDGRLKKRKVLMMIDEFSQLGRFSEIEKTLSVSAGYGICYVIAIQSFAQLQALYGRDNAKVFCDNMIIALLKLQDPESSKYFSDILGQQTIVLKKSQKSGKQFSIGTDSYSVNTSENGRPLMTPSEVAGKGGDQVIIIIPSRHPYLAKRILYYEEGLYKDKSELPYIYSQDDLSTIPSPHESMANTLQQKQEDGLPMMNFMENQISEQLHLLEENNLLGEISDEDTLSDPAEVIAGDDVI